MKLSEQRVCYVGSQGAVWRGTLEGTLKRVINAIQAIQLLCIDLKHFALDELIAIWSVTWIDSQHKLYDSPYIIRVVIGYPWEDPLAYTLVQMVHIFATKGRLE